MSILIIFSNQINNYYNTIMKNSFIFLQWFLTVWSGCTICLDRMKKNKEVDEYYNTTNTDSI